MMQDYNASSLVQFKAALPADAENQIGVAVTVHKANATQLLDDSAVADLSAVGTSMLQLLKSLREARLNFVLLEFFLEKLFCFWLTVEDTPAQNIQKYKFREAIPLLQALAQGDSQSLLCMQQAEGAGLLRAIVNVRDPHLKRIMGDSMTMLANQLMSSVSHALQAYLANDSWFLVLAHDTLDALGAASGDQGKAARHTHWYIYKHIYIYVFMIFFLSTIIHLEKLYLSIWLVGAEFVKKEICQAGVNTILEGLKADATKKEEVAKTKASFSKTTIIKTATT